MAVISNQSVYVDVKQLLPLSYELNGYLTTRDQCIIGNQLVTTLNKQKVLKAISILRLKLKEINVEIHPKKFYCQHYTKGLEFLGYHIKQGRMILNNKIVNRALESSSYKGPVNKFQCKINSYSGMLQHGTNQKKLHEMMSKIKRKDVIIKGNKILIKNKQQK